VAVEKELDAIRAWANRHGWTVLWSPERLVIRLATYHGPVERLVELVGEVEGYRALPPMWRFVRPGTDEVDKAWFPSAGPNSTFHGDGVICAPWNRLAYGEHGGPHGDWGGPGAWLQVTGVTTAHTIPDMLAIVDANLRQSPGMMA
jgi:hypothetical protein